MLCNRPGLVHLRELHVVCGRSDSAGGRLRRAYLGAHRVLLRGMRQGKRIGDCTARSSTRVNGCSYRWLSPSSLWRRCASAAAAVRGL